MYPKQGFKADDYCDYGEVKYGQDKKNQKINKGIK